MVWTTCFTDEVQDRVKPQKKNTTMPMSEIHILITITQIYLSTVDKWHTALTLYKILYKIYKGLQPKYNNSVSNANYITLLIHTLNCL